MSHLNAFAIELRSVIHLLCQLVIWLCQFDIYNCSQSQDQCGIIIHSCYNSDCLSHAISWACSSSLSMTLHWCTALWDNQPSSLPKISPNVHRFTKFVSDRL